MSLIQDVAPERLTICDVTGSIEDHNGLLGIALAQWAVRDDSKADPEARRAANTAMEAIDAMLAELHAVRSRLVAEKRQSDDANDARLATKK